MVDDVEISPHLVTGWFEKMGQTYNILKIAIDNFRYSLLNSEFKKIGFDAFERKNILLVRPNHNIVFGDTPIMRWYTNNTKKQMDSNGNITYGKIEPNYRKTDGFMAFVNTIVILDEIPEEIDYKEIDFGVYTY